MINCPITTKKNVSLCVISLSSVFQEKNIYFDNNNNNNNNNNRYLYKIVFTKMKKYCNLVEIMSYIKFFILIFLLKK